MKFIRFWYFIGMLKTELQWWVTVMLVTSLCWWLYDGDWFEMLVAESLCWRLFSLCWWYFQCIKSVTNISNMSPTHWSPTSVTNINVTTMMLRTFKLKFLDEKLSPILSPFFVILFDICCHTASMGGRTLILILGLHVIFCKDSIEHKLTEVSFFCK